VLPEVTFVMAGGRTLQVPIEIFAGFLQLAVNLCAILSPLDPKS
jgi:hypothetical protein